MGGHHPGSKLSSRVTRHLPLDLTIRCAAKIARLLTAQPWPIGSTNAFSQRYIGHVSKVNKTASLITLRTAADLRIDRRLFNKTSLNIENISFLLLPSILKLGARKTPRINGT
jgi:hypothetical protein